ncbi:hypothetical protein OG389_29690 [Streptomyces sp. NBC_00435]|uniref:hypothetical protein n=1 Tax=Streptomyces sp. NBC_00435 TaxID=2903649 RepID=UPI002E1F9C40
MKRKIVASLAGGVLLAGLAALPAQAENSRTSYISWWQPGKESSRWWDNNNDSASTTVALNGCDTTGHFSWASLSLWRDVSLSPDRGYGGRTNYCGASEWGDVTAGSYYFKLDGFADGDAFNASTVNIYW